jgi:anti-sigma regulatory factor (Ser/Thr protein kinase)
MTTAVPCGTQQHAPTPCRPLTCRLELCATPSAVPCARSLARRIVLEWGRCDLADTAELLVSELVTNAIQHVGPGAAETVLRLEYGGSWLRIEVHDASPHGPQPRTPDWLDESGFGLLLVDALADKWGVEQTAQGKAVWAELDARPGGAAE